jgi:hypothetical protein
MLGNSAKTWSKYGTFYDLPVLLMLIFLTPARQRGATENLVFFFFFAYLVSEFDGQTLYNENNTGND